MENPTFEESLHMIDIEYKDGRIATFASGYFPPSEDLEKRALIYLDLSRQRVAFPNALKFTVRKATEEERMQIEEHDRWLRERAK